MRRLVITILLFAIATLAIAQDSRNPATITSSKTVSFSAEQLLTIRKAIQQHPYTEYYNRLVSEYEERMIANVKKYKVMARKMEKPQYSDPSYFGHKRKPKKRPVGKRKYCKECEIVH